MNQLPSTDTPLTERISIPPTSAPPPPPEPIDPRTNISPVVLKLKSKAHNPFFSVSKEKRTIPIGLYFFYGSLLDPCMLSEILGLDHKPELRPASLDGYECKLWGQYPALVSSTGTSTVEGAVYEVTSLKDAEKLAKYETDNYQAVSCSIRYTDGREPAQQMGSVFLFVGNPRDLSEGVFDLRVWLKRVGRYAALEQLEAMTRSTLKGSEG